MKAILLACVLLGLTGQSYASSGDDFDIETVNNQERTIYLNTSSTSTYLVLAGAVLMVGVLALLAFSSFGASSSSSYYNRNDYENYDPYADAQYGQQYAQSQYRSAQNGFLDGLNILSLLSMAQDAYENFDYNDLDCQKRLVCEVMKEPEYYGSVATKFATGFEYAKYLELMNMPDDIRELLDEYLDANSRAKDQKTCQDFFTCPYSIKDSMKRNVAVSNNL